MEKGAYLLRCCNGDTSVKGVVLIGSFRKIGKCKKNNKIERKSSMRT